MSLYFKCILTPSTSLVPVQHRQQRLNYKCTHNSRDLGHTKVNRKFYKNCKVQNKILIDTDAKDRKSHARMSDQSWPTIINMSVNAAEAVLQFFKWKQRHPHLCLAVQTWWAEEMWLWKGRWIQLGVIRFVHWWSTWLKHLLHQVEADTRFALILSHRKVVEQVKMSHVWAIRVSVLVDQPFPFAGVGMPSADVLGLKML